MVPGAPIVARLADEDPGVRWLAARALAAPHAGDLGKLEKLLQDPKTVPPPLRDGPIFSTFRRAVFGILNTDFSE